MVRGRLRHAQPETAPGGKSADTSGEAELIGRVMTGDAGAGEEFVRRYGRLIHFILARMDFSVQEREDLYQQVFVHLWEEDYRRLRAWRQEGLFSGFLSCVVTRLAQDRLRQVRIRQQRLGADEPDQELNAAAPSVERQVETRFCYRALTHALTKLPPREVRLLCFRHIEGMSYKELAGALNITVNHVGVALWKAERRVRSYVCTEYPGLFEENAPKNTGDCR